MSNEEQTKDFQGIKKHHIAILPLYEPERRESINETLSHLNIEEDNIGMFPRTTHLYKSNLDILDKIAEKVNEDNNFINCIVQHEASHLGFTHKIVAEHSSGSILTFDGLYLTSTLKISDELFNLDELLSLTGAPSYQHDVTAPFRTIIREMRDEPYLRGHSHYSYYTIDNTNFTRLSFTRQGNAQARLILNDPNFITITAVIFSSKGKDFHVYMGEEEQINQMIAQDYFIDYELEKYISFFSDKINLLIKYHEDIIDDMGGILLSVWSIRQKNIMWNNVKKTILSLYEIQDYVEKGRLLVRTIKKFIDEKYAFFNGPRQIWLLDQEVDLEERIQHRVKHFWEMNVNGTEIKISDEPIEPFYTSTCQRLDKKIEYIAKFAEKVYEKERDLLTGYQTEFSLYAVWLAILATLLGIFSIIDIGVILTNMMKFIYQQLLNIPA